MLLKIILLLNLYYVVSWDISMYNYMIMGIRKEISSQISFQYYKGPTVNDYTKFSLLTGPQILNQATYDKSKETVFFFHGWSERPSDLGPNGYSINIIAQAFLVSRRANFIVINYENLVQHYYNITTWTPEIMNMGAGYVSAVQNTTQIGAALGFFFKMFTTLCLCENNLRLVGFSIGAQIISYVAAVYGEGRLKRLTALDAAGPIYSIPGYDHLDTYQGIFIDSIHTDAGGFGFGSSYGNVDFWPNFGRQIQPPCRTSTEAKCSHYTSVKYFAESVMNPMAFKGVLCPNPVMWSTYMCRENDVIYMGYGAAPNATHGDYYLKTNAVSPYGLSDQGLSLAR